MQIFNQVIDFFKKQSITFKHAVGISLLVFLILIVALTGFASLYYIRKADKIIQANTEIARTIFEMDLGMETARHLHGGFFLYYPRIGLRQAHENYAQPSIRKIAKVISTSDSLREIMNQPQINHSLNNSKIDLNLYLSSAKRFADTSIASFELATRLAAPETGLEALLDRQFKDLKAKLISIRTGINLSDRIKDLINEHRVNRERHIMQSAFNDIFKLRKKIEASSSVSPQQKEEINQLLNQIEETATQILNIDVQIDAKFKDFIIQEKLTRAASGNLIMLAKSEVKKSEQKIENAHKIAAVILIIITFTGLIAAGIIANILNKNITRRIVRLTCIAEKLESGNLDLVAEEGTPDELGHLGRTFNFMAARMKALIENLEQEVQDRTLELRNTNTELQIEISERKLMEEMIREKEAFLDRVIEQSPFPTWISDAKGTLQRTNIALKKALNLTDEQLVGKYNIFKDPVVKRQGLIPLIRTVYEKGQSINFAGEWNSKDIPTMNLKGTSLVTIDVTMFPILNSQKEVINVVLIWVDTTERKRAEIEKQLLEKKLRQSHKMEAIGTLAGGIAHDFNNILSIMLGNTELALSEIPEWSPARESLQEIKTAGLRAKEVVRQLLSFSRKTEQNQTPQDIGQIVRESVKLLRSTIPSTIRIVENISEHKSMVLANATQIHQIVLNLCTNAAHAMEEKGGTMEILLTNLTLKRKRGGRFKKLLPGEYVELTVKDTGTGIDPEIYEKIFDPYYTTKEFGKGTGMGLAVVHGIVKNHNGSIQVKSQLDIGSSFSIFFPRIDQSETDRPETKMEKIPTGTEKILFVDDEPAIVEITLKLLERLGYQVKGKTDPVDAIKEFEQNPQNFDLIITDMTMPQMDGVQFTKALKNLRPDIPVIICTGHSTKLNEENASDIGISAYAKKPVSMLDMAKLIREVLD